MTKHSHHECDECGKSFSSKRTLSQHKSAAHPLDSSSENDYEEDAFSDSSYTPRKQTLKRRKSHATSSSKKNKSPVKKNTKGASPSKKKLSCSHCKKVFAYQGCLDNHVKTGNCVLSLPGSSNSQTSTSHKELKDTSIEGKGGKSHICQTCGKRFSRKSSLEGHELVHITDVYVKEEMPDNDDDFVFLEENTSSDEKSEKQEAMLSIKKSYTCKNCNFVCFSKQTLDKHVLIHHKEPDEDEEASIESNNQNTESVKKSLSIKKEFSFTMKEKETFKCDKCAKVFCKEGSLKKHIVTHDEDYVQPRIKKIRMSDKVECKLCHKQFLNKACLLKHEEHHETFKCDKCVKVFCKEGSLKKHLITHDEDYVQPWVKRRRISNKVECEVCHKQFLSKACLSRHEERHKNPVLEDKKVRGVHRFTCEYCKEVFNCKKYIFMKHVHTHTPEVCGICDERFVDRASLREHCKVHIDTEEGRLFVQCSQKALDAKNGIITPEPKTEYIYLVVR